MTKYDKLIKAIKSNSIGFKPGSAITTEVIHKGLLWDSIVHVDTLRNGFDHDIVVIPREALSPFIDE